MFKRTPRRRIHLVDLGLRNGTEYLHFRRDFGIARTVEFILRDIYLRVLPSVIDLKGERTIQVNGSYLHLMPNDSGISLELKIFGNHEPLAVDLLKHALRKGMVCVDIGANIGFYAILEGRIVGSSGKVVAIEPAPAAYGYLVRNLSINGVNFEVCNAAISDVVGEVLFKQDRRSNAGMVVGSARSIGGDVISVKSLTLDTLLSELRLSRVDLIQMDVEGHEVNVARGWNETIRRHKPMVFIEVHKRIGKRAIVDLLRFLDLQGYRRAFYVDRRVNTPLLARKKDVKETSVRRLLDEFNAGLIPLTDFHLFAWPDLD